MALTPKQFGFAAVSRDGGGIYSEFPNIEMCKRYSPPNALIVRRTPIFNGVSITLRFYPWVQFKFYRMRRTGLFIYFAWLFISITPEYYHRSGRVVFDKANELNGEA